MVFQWGWLEDLGFEPISSIDSTIPPLVLAMTFGLSMDYEIFLLTRIRERFLQTNNTRDAVAYGVSTSARTITSAALIMIAVFIGFAFAGMPLVAQLGVACAVAIAVDATVVRLVLVPALMAMFDQWNWWLPRWLARILPSVDFEKPLPKVDLGDLVDHSRRHLRAGGVRASTSAMVVKSAAKLKNHGAATRSPSPTRWRSAAACRPRLLPARVKGGDEPAARHVDGRTNGHANGHTDHGPARRRSCGAAGGPCIRSRCGAAGCRWRWTRWKPRPTPTQPPVERNSPVETTNVQLPTGDRLQIPTGAETLRLKSYLIMCRNSSQDFAEFADLVDVDGDSNRGSGTGRHGPVLLW